MEAYLTLVMGPEREGLANTFGQYVAEDVAGFSAQAAVMLGCSPIYVRTIISKMDEAVKAGQPVDLPAILDLCNWVVDQSATECVGSAHDDVELWDRSWEWTRGGRRLVGSVCKAAVNGVPKYNVEQYRPPVWKLLERLTQDRADRP